MIEFCIVNPRTKEKVDEIAKNIGINTESVHQVVKKWFEQHPVYNEDGSVDIDVTTDVDNMPAIGYIMAKCFPDYVKSKDVYQKELDEIKSKAISDGTFMKAPNGNPTNLTERQWLQVRTKSFKEWFGDWENDQENASKVVDENGEPLIVYHGNPDISITIFGSKDGRFNKSKAGKFYFTPDEGVAQTYTEEDENASFFKIKGVTAPEIYDDDYYDYLSYDDYKKSKDYKPGRIYEVFLNLRNPVKDINPQSTKEDVLKHHPNADGFISYKVIDDYHGNVLHTDEEHEAFGTKQYVVFNPNQIKSATDNNGGFSDVVDDIRYNIEPEDVYDVLDYFAKLFVLTEEGRGRVVSNRYDMHFIPKSHYRQSLQEIERIRKAHLLPEDIFEIKKLNNSTIITLNKDALKDKVARLENNEFTDLFESAEQAKQVQYILDVLSAKTGIGYQTISEDEAKKILKLRRDISNINSFVKGNTCYFIQGRKLNVDIASEEMLHPFVASIKKTNPDAFASLLEDARKSYPKLRLEIKQVYKDNIEEELVTQALSRAFRSDIQNNPEGHRLRDLIHNFIKAIKKIFGKSDEIETYFHSIEDILENKAITARDLSDRIKIDDLALIVNSDIERLYSGFLDEIRLNEEQLQREERYEDQQRKKIQVGQNAFTLYKKLIDQNEGSHIFTYTSEDERSEKIKYLKGNGFTDDSFSLFDGQDVEGNHTYGLRFYEHIQERKKIFQDKIELTSVVDQDDPSLLTDEHPLLDHNGEQVIINRGQLDAIQDILNKFGQSINNPYKLSDSKHYVKKNDNFGSEYRRIDALNDFIKTLINDGVPTWMPRLVGNWNLSEFINGLDGKSTWVVGELKKDNFGEYFQLYEPFQKLLSITKFGPTMIMMDVNNDSDELRNQTDFMNFLESMSNGSFLTPESLGLLSLFSDVETERKFQFDNANNTNKAASATLYIGYGRPGSTAFKYMQYYSGQGKSISGYSRFEYEINDDVDITENDRIFVYIDKNASQKEIDMTKTAISRAIERGATVILDSNSIANLNDNSVLTWIQSTYLLKPTNVYNQYVTYQDKTKTSIWTKIERPQSDNSQKYSVQEFEDPDKIYEKYCEISTDESVDTDVNQLQNLIQQIGPAAKIHFQTENLEELIKTIGVIQQNKDLMLYRIPESQTQINIGKDSDLFRLALENKVQYKKDKESGDVTLFVYDYTTYLSHDEVKRNNQYQRLFETSKLKASELSSLSKAAIFKLSDTVSLLQKDDAEKQKLIDILKLDQNEWNKVDFKTMQRIDIINRIGFDNLIRYIRERYFNIRNIDNAESMKIGLQNKLKFIYQNFDAFIEFGKQQLINLESIALSQSKNVKTDINDIINPEDEQEIQEIYGSSLEHWQIGFRQVSVFGSLSQMIKNKINTLYQYDENYEIVKDKFGFELRLNPSEAVSKILNFVQYAYDIDDMVDKLKLHLNGNPWLKQIIDVLQDPQQTQFKSQFYTNFKKYFQTYGILFKDKDNVLNMKIINESDIATDLLNNVRELFRTKKSSLFTKLNHVNQDTVAKLRELANEIKQKSESGNDIAEQLSEVFGLLDISHTTITEIQATISKKDIDDIPKKIGFLIKKAEEIDNGKYKNETEFRKALTEFANSNEYRYFANLSGRSINSGFESMSYESGKMHYSYVTPSFLNMFIGKLKGNIDPNISYEDFIETEFGRYEWFKKLDINKGKERYRLSWLRQLYENEDARRVLQHKVQINNQGVEYDAKSPIQYIESVVKEFFYDKNKGLAWYRIPVMSNKPSEEYIRFYRIHDGFKTKIRKELLQVAYQEIDRILAVRQREKNGAKNKIKNFDGKRGKQFCLLTFLNDNEYVNQYIDDKFNGKVVDNNQLVTELNNAIDEYFSNQVSKTKDNWIKIGFIGRTFDSKNNEKLISPINVDFGKTNEEIMDSIEEFVWNDTFAAINILELTISDPALYKDSEDIQKRLAQLHAPGVRPDLKAFDRFNNQRFSDGTFRTIFIKDFDNIKSEVLNDLKDVFDKLIQKEEDEITRNVLIAKRDFVLKAFSETNIADGQGYSSPTSYRKKMGLFGKWGDREEQVYQRILNGDFTHQDLDVAFQPLKPFVYGFTSRNGYNDIMTNIKVGTQCKNSEYLLVMADALLRSGGKTNYLTSIFDFMEESQGLTKTSDGKWIGTPNTRGIDTVLFESAIKTGLVNPIDISSDAIESFRNRRGQDYWKNKSDEEVVKQILKDAVYTRQPVDKDNPYSGYMYNTDNVSEMDFNNYSIQQEVPQHFKGEQLQGSQQRILLFAGLDDNAYIEVNGEQVQVKEAKQRYYDAISLNINDSVDKLMDKLKLGSSDRITKNVVLSRMLREKILEDARYDTNLLYAVTVNNNGEFNIPLSDPIQSDMIMKLLNSLIKNDVDKQKVPGGPVVQVSRFGSKQLSIRFKDNEGKLLLNRDEFERYLKGEKIDLDFDYDIADQYKSYPNIDNAYNNYRNSHRYSVAYMECYAPIYDDNLFKDFADEDGNIDVKKILKENPKLLYMVGYRIPTESHYSMIPLKIIGFLPRESGEGIMLPDEFVTMSGSDKISLFLPL